MKLALVSGKTPGQRKTPPLGLASLATYLDKKLGFKDTVIIDSNYEDVHLRLKALQPELVGISAMSISYGDAIALARGIREYSDALIAIGGVHISTMPGSFSRVFDFGVIGEGEVTLSEVVSRFQANGGLDNRTLSEIPGIVYWDEKEGLRQTPRRPLVANLDEIPFPDTSYLNPVYFEPREEVALKMIVPCGPIFTARGCPYRCAFCSTALFWNRYRTHSVSYIAENIRYLVEKYNVKLIDILDDMFTVNKKRLRELHSVMEQQGLLGKVVFRCSARVNHIDDEMCEILAGLNVKQLRFGFESGSDRVLKYLKAGSASLKQNQDAVIRSKKHGFVVLGSLIFGSPGETAEDMRETLDFIEFAKKEGVDSIWPFVATPLPGTEFWEEAKKRGRVSDDMDWEHESAMFSLYENFEDPPLIDVKPEEFKKIFFDARKRLRLMRVRIILRFLLSNPVKAVAQFARNMPFYFKRFYEELFRN